MRQMWLDEVSQVAGQEGDAQVQKGVLFPLYSVACFVVSVIKKYCVGFPVLL